MTWTDVDGVREHLGGREKVDRRTVYRMVEQGMRVARVSATGPRRDTKGRLRNGRLFFALEWVDEFLAHRAKAAESTEKQQPIALARVG